MGDNSSAYTSFDTSNENPSRVKKLRRPSLPNTMADNDTDAVYSDWCSLSPLEQSLACECTMDDKSQRSLVDQCKDQVACAPGTPDCLPAGLYSVEQCASDEANG